MRLPDVVAPDLRILFVGINPSLTSARLFVLPNPSGLNASYPGFEDKLVWFRRLRWFCERAVAIDNELPTWQRLPSA